MVVAFSNSVVDRYWVLAEPRRATGVGEREAVDRVLNHPIIRPGRHMEKLNEQIAARARHLLSGTTITILGICEYSL